MFVCDICQKELLPGQSIPVSMDEIARIIQNGFSPMRVDIRVYENGVQTTSYRQMVRNMAPDASVEELEDIWRRTALTQTQGGWALCTECYSHTRLYR